MILVGSPFFYIFIVLLLFYFVLFKFVKKTVVKVVFFNLIAILFLFSLFDTVAMFFDKSHSLYNTFRRPDFYYHHGLKKNQSALGWWDKPNNQIYEVFTNSLGFMDRSVRKVPLKSKKRRFVFIGDSFTEGVGFPYDETFAGIVGNYLQKRGYSFLNAGVLSYSPKLHYLKMKYFIEQKHLKFDDLYVFVDISDIQDEIIYDYFVPVLPPKPNFKMRVVDFFVKNSFVYRKYFLKKIDSLNPKRCFSDFWKPAKNCYSVKDSWTVDRKQFKKWGKKGVASALRYEDLLFKLCKKHGITMHLVVYPWPRLIEERDFPSLQEKIWKKFTEERGIDFIDGFPMFFKGNPENVVKKYFIPGDVHWNKKGHKFFANFLIGNIDKYLKTIFPEKDDKVRKNNE